MCRRGAGVLQNLALPKPSQEAGGGRSFALQISRGLHKLIVTFTVLVLCFPSTGIPLFLGLFCKILTVTENYGQSSARSSTLSAGG